MKYFIHYPSTLVIPYSLFDIDFSEDTKEFIQNNMNNFMLL